MRPLIDRLRVLLTRKHFRGTDPAGNRYFEELDAHPGRSRRTVQVYGHRRDASGLAGYLYDQSSIPAQWRAWLTHTRPDAPTLQEVEEDMKFRAEIRRRAEELEQKWQVEKQKLLMDEEYQRLQAQIAQENQARVVDWEHMLGVKKPLIQEEKRELGEESEDRQKEPVMVKLEDVPTGQGETFVPGSWNPNKK